MSWRRIEGVGDCDICSAALVLLTTAFQPPRSWGGWAANEDDVATCVECDAVHQLRHDGEGGGGWFECADDSPESE